MNDFLDKLNSLWNLDDLFNLQNNWQHLAVWATVLATIIVLSYVIGWLVRAVIGGLIASIARKTQTKWDDFLFDKRFFSKLGTFLPAIASYFFFIGIVSPGEPKSLDATLFALVNKVLLLWIVLSGTAFLNQVVENFEKGFIEVAGDKRVPIRSYVQVVKLLLTLIAGILAFSIVLDQNPLGILTGLGALTAVLLLVFRDALLGLVASLQVNSNNLVQLGDWIEFPGQNIDGEVIDIALSVVKIKSGDNTVYTLPTYNLVSVPFKNWRNVNDMGSRRIKMAFPVDALTLTPVTPSQVKALKSSGLWKVPESLTEVTNLEAFRFWAQDHLESHGDVSTSQSRVVKLGEPMGRGLPLEFVFYTKVTGYPDFELLRSRLYCHYLAQLPSFGLRTFQEPVGTVEGHSPRRV